MYQLKEMEAEGFEVKKNDSEEEQITRTNGKGFAVWISLEGRYQVKVRDIYNVEINNKGRAFMTGKGTGSEVYISKVKEVKMASTSGKLEPQLQIEI